MKPRIRIRDADPVSGIQNKIRNKKNDWILILIPMK
jgi:hypothetical protein